jgi:uncharacterized LabA/DUF88 family protein
MMLVDGENFKGKIKNVCNELGIDHPLWHEFDFKKLFATVFQGEPIDRIIFYFASIKRHAESSEKSTQLIEEQRRLKNWLERQGFEVVLSGRVRGQYEIGINGKKHLVFKEKGVDVQIAVDMVCHACDKAVDELILASSDSDLQPAIRETRKRSIPITYLGFEHNPNKDCLTQPIKRF